MAKSLRAKSKQANRRKKRNDENSYYKAVSAARLKAVSDKLLGKDGEEKEMEVEEEANGEGADQAETEPVKKISTSGPRQNRREAWRESKGMIPRPKSQGQNKQLKAAGKRKAGRPKRRR